MSKKPFQRWTGSQWFNSSEIGGFRNGRCSENLRGNYSLTLLKRDLVKSSRRNWDQGRRSDGHGSHACCRGAAGAAAAPPREDRILMSSDVLAIRDSGHQGRPRITGWMKKPKPCGGVPKPVKRFQEEAATMKKKLVDSGERRSQVSRV